jgi:hypothetical protein
MNIHEKSALALIPGGTDALAAIDTVTERLADLQQRAKDADQAVENARHGRRQLVHRAAVGEIVAPATISKADKSVADAEGIATLAREAVQAGRSALSDAEGEASALIAADRSRRFREAAERRIKAAEELDRLGAAFGKAVAEFADAGAALSPLIDSTEKMAQRIVSLRDRRAAYAVLPVNVQNDIVQMGRAAVTGAVLSPRERALWS